jgi:hypothetical protein
MDVSTIGRSTLNAQLAKSPTGQPVKPPLESRNYISRQVLPQVAEENTPQSTDAAGEPLL